MSITIFNKPAFFMGLAAFGAALALRLQWPNHIPDNVLFTLAAVLCVGLDLLWRAGKGKRHWFKPSQGGAFVSVPLWILGVVWIGFTVYQMYHGPITSFTRAAMPMSTKH